ncbi:MAG: HYR domain-containing protein [Acidobacteria bacterium]|nr:HYR domain-containing protein [Acidobacteriota bacterium]MBV9476132.1 HYR domain-containing protein [Acidobacteriota bacterium]
MRVILAVVLCLLALPLLADEITGVSPSQLTVFDIESFVTLRGSGFLGATAPPDSPGDNTVVTFAGDAGSFSVNASNVDNNTLIVWVPIEVAINEGHYQIFVDVDDGGGVIRHIGPAEFDVVPQPVIAGPPTINVPETVIGEVANDRGAPVSFDVTAQSYDGTPLTPSCDHDSGSFFSFGATRVQCTATDANGSATASFVVLVTDTTPPVLTLPADFATNDTTVNYSVSAVDAFDGPVDVTCDPPSGATFPRGTVEVMCVAVDSSLNPVFGSFLVHVAEPPVLNLPGNITAEATSPSGAVVNYTVTATADGVVACTPPSGSTFALGTTTVNCTATNSAGSTSGSFTVTVVDTTPPVVTSTTASPNSIWPPNHKMVNVTVTVNAIDAVDLTPTSRIIGVTSNQPINGPGDGNTNSDWVITGPLTLQLRAERAGSNDRVYTITVETKDDAGNATTSTVKVTVTQGGKQHAVR